MGFLKIFKSSSSSSQNPSSSSSNGPPSSHPSTSSRSSSTPSAVTNKRQRDSNALQSTPYESIPRTDRLPVAGPSRRIVSSAVGQEIKLDLDLGDGQTDYFAGMDWLAKEANQGDSLRERPAAIHYQSHRPETSTTTTSPAIPPQRRSSLLTPGLLKAKSVETLGSTWRSESPLPDLPITKEIVKGGKQRKSFFGIKGLGSRMDLSKAGNASSPQLDPPIALSSSQEYDLEPPPSRTSIFSSSRSSFSRSETPTSPAGSPGHRHLRQASASSLPVYGPSSTSLLDSSALQEEDPGLAIIDKVGTGFPWMSNSRSSSKSPAPVRVISATELDSVESTMSNNVVTPYPMESPTSAPSSLLSHMPAAFGKVRSRSRDVSAPKKGKSLADSSSPPLVVVPLGEGDDDPSFQLRSFRHVSSGSGMEPGPEISYVPVSVPTNSRSVARPPLPRPTSVMSINEDRKVSVQLFRQSRRWSMTSEAREEELKEVLRSSLDMERASTETAALRRLSQGRRNLSESGMEILISPEKRRPAVGSQAGGQTSPTASVIPRSVSTSVLSDDMPVTVRQQLATERNGFVVSGRKTSMEGGSTEGRTLIGRQPSVVKQHRPSLDIPRRQVDSWYGQDLATDPKPMQGKYLSQPNSPTSRTFIRSESPTPISPESIAPKAGGRAPLSARLASATTSTSASSIPDLACEIPSVKPPAAIAPQRPTGKPEYARSVSAMSQSKTKAKNAWDLSSSDEDDDISQSDAQRLRRNFSKLRTGSMPSGLRRPPSTAIAFGDEKRNVERPVLPPKSISSSNLLSHLPKQHRSSTFLPGKMRGTNQRPEMRQPPSSGVSEEDTSSSEDEALSRVMQRKSSAMSLPATSGQQRPLPVTHLKVSSGEDSSISPTSSTRTTTPGKATPRPATRNASPLPKFSMGPPAMPFAGPISPHVIGPPVRPFGLTTAGQTPRESPSSSQSGTTGDTSSAGAPLTPRDGSSGSDIGIVSSNATTESGRSINDKAAIERAARNRRVSFMDTDWDAAKDAAAERKRKERRRDEAKQAIELGHAFNGSTPRSRDRPYQEEAGIFNPYLGGRPPSTSMPMQQSMDHQHMMAMQMQMQQPVDQQQKMAMQMQMQQPMDQQQFMAMQMQMQMAQMNPAFMQMHHYAMMMAKQQYQASVAAAALQAANDEWERSSNMTGLNSQSPNIPMYGGGGMPQFPMMMPGMPGMSGMPMGSASAYGGGSVYGGFSGSQAGAPHWGSTSAYGEAFGPSTVPRSTSAPKLQTTPAAQPQRPGPGVVQSRRKDRSSSASMSLLADQPIPNSKSTRSPERSRRGVGSTSSRTIVTSPLADIDSPLSSGSLPPSSWRGNERPVS